MSVHRKRSTAVKIKRHSGGRNSRSITPNRNYQLLRGFSVHVRSRRVGQVCVRPGTQQLKLQNGRATATKALLLERSCRVPGHWMKPGRRSGRKDRAACTIVDGPCDRPWETARERDGGRAWACVGACGCEHACSFEGLGICSAFYGRACLLFAFFTLVCSLSYSARVG